MYSQHLFFADREEIQHLSLTFLPITRIRAMEYASS